MTPKHGQNTGTVTSNIGITVGIQLNKDENMAQVNDSKIRILQYPPDTMQKKLTGLQQFPIGTVPIFPSYESITINIKKLNERWLNLYSEPGYDVPPEITIKLFGYKLAPAFANIDYGCQVTP